MSWPIFLNQPLQVRRRRNQQKREITTMGNRAIITTEKKEIGVYLHWNGGRDSVEAFLEYCKRAGHRSPDKDCYGWARLCQVISNFLEGKQASALTCLRNLTVTMVTMESILLKTGKLSAENTILEKNKENIN